MTSNPECTASTVIVFDDPSSKWSFLEESCKYPVLVNVLSLLEEFAPPKTASSCILVNATQFPNWQDLVATLLTNRDCPPVAVLCPENDGRGAVAAMKLGVFQVVLTPFLPSEVVTCVNEAIQEHQKAQLHRETEERLHQRLAKLSERERQVCRLLAAGKSIKQISLELGTASSTVRKQRAGVFEKLDVNDVAHLILLMKAAKRE